MLRLLIACCLALPLVPFAQDWGPMATISSTMGINGGRLCLGEASRGDIGCPTYAPSVTATGHVSVTGNLSASKFIGDGSGLIGVTGSSDRITSGTTSVITNINGYTYFTTGGVNTGYFNTAGLLVLPGISTTSLHGISSTNGYFSGNIGMGVSPSTYGFQLVGDGGAYDDFTLDGYTDTASSSPLFQMRRGRGTATAATAVQTNDTLGFVRFAGYNGSGFTSAVLLAGYADGDFSTAATRNSSIRFSTLNANSFAERMRISPNGNVGIGSQSPSYALQVYGGTASSSIALSRANSPANFLKLTYEGAEAALGTTGNDGLSLQTAGITRMTVHQAGNVGIGTAVPKATLEVSGSVATSEGLMLPLIKLNTVQETYDRIMNGTLNDSGALALVSATDIGLTNNEIVLLKADGQVNNDDGFSVVQWDSTGFKYAPFRVTGAGRVGIGGMLAPAYPLDVSGTVRATTFIGDGSNLTNLTGDNLGNHTATQNVGMGTNALVFGNSLVDKIYLYSNTYGIGIESSNLTNWSGSSFRWRVGGTSASAGTQVMALTAVGLTISGSVLVNNTGDLATAPSYSWSGDTNTGMYWVTTDQIGVTTGGTQRMLINSSGLKVTGYVSTTGILDAGGPIYGYQGDGVTAPGYTWSGDTHTGMYWVGNDQIGLTVGGVQQVLVRSTGIVVSGSIMANNVGDLATAPSYSWSGDPNTGFYWVGSDQIGVSTGSGQRLLVNSSGLRVTGAITTVGGNVTVDGVLNASDGASIGNGSFVLSGSRDITSAIAGGQIFIQDSTTSNSGSKVRIDVNELQAQVDGGVGSYTLNPFGGQVNIGSASFGANLVVRGTGTTCTIGSGTGATACSSDRRLKQDIQPLQGSLEKIAALQGVHFKWKKDPSATRIGLIAQEVEKQFPEVVETDPETGMKAVAYPSLVAPLIEAVKELKLRNEKLEAANESLRRDVKALKTAIQGKSRP